PELNDFMTNKLIKQRNHHMAERMLPKLSSKATFVAIGALHLPGQDGVLSLLEKNGYKIRRRF
ncbi:MAG: TraB/GumN family protein, partial [Sneathiella sp.]|nr:TraB/GumN family protein [Sneathiella sp.]